MSGFSFDRPSASSSYKLSPVDNDSDTCRLTSSEVVNVVFAAVRIGLSVMDFGKSSRIGF